MTKPKKSGIGLYVGASFIDLVELVDEGGRARLARSARVPLAKEAAAAAVSEPPDVSAAVREALQKTGLVNPDVTTSLAARDITVRHFLMPKVPKKEREAAIKFEAKKYIPFRIEELVSTSLVLEERATQMAVLFVASKRDQVGEHLAALSGAGIKSVSLDAAPFALVSLLEWTKQLDPKGATVVLHVNDETSATLAIVQGEIPLVTRDISIGPEVAGQIARVQSELELSFSYFRRQYPSTAIARLVLAGESAFPGWVESLGASLGMPVQVIQPSIGVVSTTPIAPGSSMAVGLALRALYPSKKAPVSLLPTAARPVRETMLPLIAVEAGIVLVSLFAVQFLLWREQALILGVADQIRRSFPVEKQMFFDRGLQELSDAKQEFEEQIGFLQPLVTNRLVLTRKWSALSGMVPPEVWVTSLDFDDRLQTRLSPGSGRAGFRWARTLSLKGLAASRNRQEESRIANKLLRDLKGNKEFFEGFDDASLSKTQVDKFRGEEVTRFEIQVVTKQ